VLPEADVYDVVIIGGGPGGYASALYAHNFGLKVALIEKDTVGGTCLVRGCIPAKTWLHAAEVFTTVKNASTYGVNTSEPTVDWTAALARKNQIVGQLVKGVSGLLKARNVDSFDGFGRLVEGGVHVALSDGTEQTLETKNVILATGSVPSSIPGFDFNGTSVISSNEALDWEARPGRVAIVGGGVIGCEFASLLADFGTEVHVFDVAPQLLPGTDPDAVKVLLREFKKRKIKVHTDISVAAPEIIDGGVRLSYGEDSVEVDVVLVSVGRAPFTENVGIEEAGITLDRGFVPVDLETMQTSKSGIYAVGDIVAGTPQLAHAGFAEGIAAIEHIATGVAKPVDYNAIPLVVYTHPEIASVGLTEQAARDKGLDVEVTTHGMRGIGRAIIQGQVSGMVKLVCEKDGPILGATVVGPGAGELIHELMYTVAWEALPEEAAALIHAHPTVAESIGETLLSASGKSLH
jgi:dihydrolipoyl dehydrogenase